MNIADRVMLALYTVIMAIISALVIAFSAGAISFETVSYYIQAFQGSWEIITASVLFFLISIRLLITGMNIGANKEITVHIGDEGYVRISIEAIKKFIEQSALQVRGVHTVKARVKTEGDFIKAKLLAGILPEANIPETSRILQKKIKDSMKDTVGRELSDVEIIFNTISYEARNKHRLD